MKDNEESLLKLMAELQQQSDRDIRVRTAAMVEILCEKVERLNGAVAEHGKTLAVHSVLWKIFGSAVVVIAGVITAIIGGLI